MNNSEKIILDLCGGTGAWSKPYKDAGYDVRLVTLPDNDVRLYKPPDSVYGILAAPPCTEFSFAKHFHGSGNYQHNFLSGLSVVDACLRIIMVSMPKFWALENPRGCLKNWLMRPTMVFQPWHFGDSYQKETHLWGIFNIPLRQINSKPTGLKKFSQLQSKEIRPEHYGKISRQVRRAITPPGFAKAFFEANK